MLRATSTISGAHISWETRYGTAVLISPHVKFPAKSKLRRCRFRLAQFQAAEIVEFTSLRWLGIHFAFQFQMDANARASGGPFDILDLLAILQENALIQPVNSASSHCDACGRLHFRQWFRAFGGHSFYVCTVARHAMFHDLASGWRLVTLHDLARWLLSSLAAARAA